MYDPNFSPSYSVILIDQIEEYMCSLLNEVINASIVLKIK